MSEPVMMERDDVELLNKPASKKIYERNDDLDVGVDSDL